MSDKRRRAVDLATDIDALVDLGVDDNIARRLRAARRTSLSHLERGFVPSGHWVNWAPAGLALALALVTSWALLTDNAASLDADLLADSLPFDAYLDAGFEASIGRDDVELIEN